MQWDDTPGAGFTVGEPWLPIADDSTEVNVAVQQENADSMLAFFRRLTGLRRKLPALKVGSYNSIETGNDAVFAYLRGHEGQRVLVALNFGDESQQVEITLPEDEAEPLCSTHLNREGIVDFSQLELQPYEGVTLLLQDESS
jgi:alpha-glucosidase